MTEQLRVLSLVELITDDEGYASALIRGLQQTPKAIPCKYFYDKRGSELFDAITRLDEYYLTRTEVAIMKERGAEMAATLGHDCLLIEYGSGSSIKIRLLLDRLERPRAYVPIDISREHLLEAAAALAADYPDLDVRPVWADYTKAFRLPSSFSRAGRRVVYFPGSTIGNFGPTEARAFLRHIAEVVGPRGGLLIGLDLDKDSRRLDRAYNDRRGVTAQFNLNLLVRANRELGADFDLDRFVHLAFHNPAAYRVEIYIVSTASQTVRIGEHTFEFSAGERIFTEYSYKYRLDDFAALAASAGFVVERVWTDPENLFAVQYLALPG